MNSKPAFEWIKERQCVKIDKKVILLNDTDLSAIEETVSNSVYPSISIDYYCQFRNNENHSQFSKIGH